MSSNGDLLIAAQAIKIVIYHALGLWNAVIYEFQRRIHKRNEISSSNNASVTAVNDNSQSFEGLEMKEKVQAL